MDFRLLLVKAITLLCLENQIPNYTAPSTDLALTVAEKCKPTEALVVDFGVDSTTALRETVYWQCKAESYDKPTLLQRLKLKLSHESYLYEAVEKGVEDSNIERESDATQQLIRRASNLRSDIKIALNKIEIVDKLNQAVFNYASREVDDPTANDLLYNLQSEIDRLTVRPNEIVKGLVNSYNLTDAESVKGALSTAKEMLSTEGVIKFGWQGFNNLFGVNQGMRRGEFVVIGALQHKFKSGTLLSMIEQAALFNKPFMRDPSKKPLLYHMSFENDAPSDVLWIYKNLKEIETGLPIEIESMENEEDIRMASEYVQEKLSVNGYEVILERFNPSDFTYRDIFDRIEYWEMQGYEIHLCTLDYLNMISKKGCTYGAQGQEIRDLFRRVRNFFAPKGIAGATGHQLSTEAKNLERTGVEMLVNEIAELGYWDSCKTIDNEVDMEIYQHLVKLGDRTFITFRRGKHRGVNTTSEKDKFCIYEMFKVGTIPFDVNRPAMFSRRLGGGMGEQADQRAWHDLAA